ncbi:unnamed protein product [Prorocentrum cordatum]|uniref:PpiC domain-containing protein n=1 Tax=Prorocentrum cordatum TaxID=2364126 RepID=A0ABN9PI29_9DINO|nr:unnamed protein product [Polarella glacialis]
MALRSAIQWPAGRLRRAPSIVPAEGALGPTVWDAVPDCRARLPAGELEGRLRRFRSRRPGEEVPAAVPGLRRQTSEEDRQAVVAIGRLPPASEVVRAVADLDEGALSTQELADVREHLCRGPSGAGAACPHAPAQLRDFCGALGALPLCREQISCWSAARSCRERAAECARALESFLDIIDCFHSAEALSTLLGIVLAVGNHLNGGTGRGQADGFDLQALAMLEGIKDSEGRDLRHFVLDVFFHGARDKAQQLVHELWPCFLNVRRSITKDAAGTEVLNKRVNVTLEDVARLVSSLRAELEEASDTLQAALPKLEPDCTFCRCMPDIMSCTKEAVDQVCSLSDSAAARYKGLLAWLRSQDMCSGDFCLLWDNFFAPGDLMCNKGRTAYFTAAFCGGEPPGLAQLEDLWGLQQSALAPASAPPGMCDEGGQERERAWAPGMLDAEAFCRALAPCLAFPDDFDAAARAYSACLGTRDVGGDLGDVERGQMHPAIEAALFDKELELGKVLGPVETAAGWHLLLARQKNRGILSTTVRASHILVAHGWHEKPAEEEAILLAQELAGEQESINRTWRRWSFENSLPSALLEQRSDEGLRECRTGLGRHQDLRLLFRWADCYVFSVKGVLADVSRNATGPLLCSVGGAVQEVGELYTADAAASARPLADGFGARLFWSNECWQDSTGILGADGDCNVQIPLRRSPAQGGGGCEAPASVLRLRVRPTVLAYAASEPGLRLALCEEAKRRLHARVALPPE